MDLTKYSNKELEEILLSLDDYESIPVDIETFITDPYYLGDNFTNGFREYWMRVLKEIYPSPVLSPYSIVFLRGCLSYSTPIKTNEGIIPIGKLATNFYQREVPIFAHSWDERHNRPVLRRIIDAFSTGLKEVYEITFCDSSSIRCTPDHLFLNRDLNWVSINDGIHIGTKLLGNTVYSIRHVGVRLVYDLTIEETHNFTLGNNIIAHNSIGRGKTTTVAIGLLYDIYLLLCRNSPQEYLGLTPKTKIAFALFSISMDLASDVVLGTVMGLLSTSPYFSAIMREAKRQRLGTTFTKGIEFFVGSKLIHSLGRAVHCLSGDTKIYLLNGVREIKDLVGVRREDNIWTWTINKQTKSLEPARIISGVKSGRGVVYRITFNNGKHIDATENHLFMLREGMKYKKVKDLVVGDRVFSVKYYDSNGYRVIVDPFNSLNRTEHSLVSEYKFGPLSKDLCVHHNTYNKKDNRPSSLSVIKKYDHIIFHSKRSGKRFEYLKNNDLDKYREECLRSVKHLREWWDNCKENNPQHYNFLISKFTKSGFEKQKELGVGCFSSDRSYIKEYWEDIKKNDPSKVMEYIDRLVKFNKSEEGRRRASEASKKMWEEIKKDEKRYEKARRERSENNYMKKISKEEISKICTKISNSPKGKAYKTSKKNLDHLISLKWKRRKGNLLYYGWRSFCKTGEIRRISDEDLKEYFGGSYKNYEDEVNNYNLEIISIERREEEVVYDIQVEKNSNFLTEAGVIVHNSSLLDEASFSTSQTQVYDNFNSLLRRMQSRSLGGNEGAFSMSGKAWVVSSESSKNSTLNTMLQRYIGKPGVYVDGGDLSNSALWHVLPEKYKKDRFQVFIGTEAIPPRIIDFDEESERLLRNYRDLIIEVPEEHYNDFDADLHRAIQDLAGVGTVSTYRLFRLRERLNNLFSITKIFPEQIYLDFDDERQIWDSLLNPQYFKNPIYPQFQRHIHIDIGLTNDSLGIASSLIYDWKYVDIFSKDTFEKVKEYVPATLTEFAIAIRPTEGKEIPLFKIRNFINYIAQQGINIRSISCDSYQSYDLLQIMKANGFYTEKLSVDKTCIPYFTLRDQTYRLLQFYPESDLLKKELNELEVHKDYIDHPLDGCFPGDTEILLDDGSTISFLQMYNNPYREYRTISSHLGKPVSSFIRKVFLSKYAYKLMKITIDNSPPILCTLNHPFLLLDNSYRFARFLSTSDKVLTFYKDIGVLAPAPITSIEMIELNNSIPVFDIEVPLYHNFALANGSIVHNSKDTADAVCGSVFMALKYADETKIQFLNKEDTISPEITDLFWGR